MIQVGQEPFEFSFVQEALVEGSASERKRLRRGTQLLFQCEKELQREYCFVKEKSESPQSRTFANSEGGVLNILPGKVPPLMQCS